MQSSAEKGFRPYKELDMSNVAIKGVAYSLNYAAELASHYGNTPRIERMENPDSEWLEELPRLNQSYEDACRYAPNLVYIGALQTEDLETRQSPWYVHLELEPVRFGRYGEIMPEDEFLGLMDICDVFDLIWLERSFADSVRERLTAHPLLTSDQINRLEKGHNTEEICLEIRQNGALPLYFRGNIVGCCRSGHKEDECLSAHVLMENLACKAGGVLSLLHLLHNTGLQPADIDFVVECSEEAVGDMSQRGGGNMAKSIGEIAGCVNCSGFDVRGFCAGPAAALLASASMVVSGLRGNVAVVAGGSVPKLFMNSRDHVRKNLPPLENCLGNFAILLGPEDGVHPVIRLDTVGKHSVGAGATPQAITSALVFEPLQKAGLGFSDIDRYAPELHNPEITIPAGAGNVPEANYKMIAALAVMKGQLLREDITSFVERHGLKGFAHTQGHIPSGVPFIGHAVDAIMDGRMKRVMIIGKGSLFLGRLTNLADGASFIIEAPIAQSSPEESLSEEQLKGMLLDALDSMANELRK